ncbi:unnamed protein product, partial [Ectocarpus sp. 6 AP-2014]
MATSLDDNAAAEDKFAYTASEIFSIVSPYVFHTHAPRVFSEISEALRRAQDASAEVMARLEASETAQEEQRRMRAAEARGYVSRLRELQALMKARVEREIEGAKARKSLKRKLEEECVRSARLEQGLADAEDKQRRLRRKFASEKKALEQWWRSTLDQAVVSARETERSKASAKVEGAMVRRLRSLSTDVATLKGKLKLLQEENATYAEALHARTPPLSSGPLKDGRDRLPRSGSFGRRAKSEISRLSASAAAAAAMDERSTAGSEENSPRSKVSSTLTEFISGISERGLDLAVRLRKSISEHASGLGFSPRVSRRRRFFSGEDEDEEGEYEEEEEGDINGGGRAGFDVDFSWHPGHFSEPSGTQEQVQQTCEIVMQGEGAAGFAEGTVSPAATPTAVTSATGRYRLDQQATPPPPPPPPPLTEVSPAAADTHAPSVAKERAHAGSKRRGLGPFRSPFRGAVVTEAPSPITPGSGRTALDPARNNSSGGDLFLNSPTGTTAALSGRRRHQRSLGGGAAGGSNDPSLRALLASGEFFRSTEGRVEGAGGTSNDKPSRASDKGLERERAATTSGARQAERTTPPEHIGRGEPRRFERGNDKNPAAVAGPPPVGGEREDHPVCGAPSSIHRGGSSGSGVGRGDLGGGFEVQGVGHEGRGVGNFEVEGGGCGARPSSCADPAAAVVVAGGCVHGGAGEAVTGVVVEYDEEAHVSASLVDEDGLAGARRDEGLRHDRHHPLDTTSIVGGGPGGRISGSCTSAGACDARGEEGTGGGAVDHRRAGGDRSPRRRERLPQQSAAGPASARPEEDSLLSSTTAAVSSNPDMGPCRRQRLDDLFPPKDASAGDIAAPAAATVVPRTDDGGAGTGAGKGTQRLPLDDLLRDMWAVSSAEG